MEIKQSLGIKIREIRKKRKWSLLEFSLRANINRNYLGDLENGRRNPTLEILERLAKAFNMSISELTFGLEIINEKENR
ncbi:MAG TPA: helix-turn-helix transcriptional regulator [Bacilli bacterium]|nr:helix-turn-helix transcriptional regulator [Bacilli bacterium]